MGIECLTLGLTQEATADRTVTLLEHGKRIYQLPSHKDELVGSSFARLSHQFCCRGFLRGHFLCGKSNHCESWHTKEQLPESEEDLTGTDVHAATHWHHFSRSRWASLLNIVRGCGSLNVLLTRGHVQFTFLTPFWSERSYCESADLKISYHVDVLSLLSPTSELLYRPSDFPFFSPFSSVHLC